MEKKLTLKEKIINAVTTVVEKILGFFEWLGEMWSTDSSFRKLYYILVAMIVATGLKASYDYRTDAYRERTHAWKENK